jgi:hypothetical protein
MRAVIRLVRDTRLDFLTDVVDIDGKSAAAQGNMNSSGALPVTKANKTGLKARASESMPNFEPDAKEANDFSAALGRWFLRPAGAKITGQTLAVGRTSFALEVVGAQQLPVEIDTPTLVKLSRPHGKDPQGHGLTQEQIASLPAQLANPIAIFESAPDPKTGARRQNGRVVLTSLMDSQGEQVVVAVHLSKVGGRKHVINDISSMHGRTDKEIKGWVDAGLTLWFDDTLETASPEWLTTNRLQSPYVVQAAQGLGNTLRLKSEFVNTKPCPTWCEPERGAYFQPGMSLKRS